MKMKSLMVATALIGFALPAAAQSFYVVQDVKTKRCTVIDKQPVASEYTSVGPGGMIYTTRVEAENAMKTVKVCHTE